MGSASQVGSAKSDRKAVKAEVEAALKSDPQNPVALHLLGVIISDEGDPKRGIELIEQSVRLAPTSEAFNDLGQLWGKLEVFDLAEKCFFKSWQLDEQNGFAANNLARCFDLKGDLAQALNWFAQAHKVQPEVALFTQNYADALVRDNRQEAAVGLILSRGQSALDDPALSFVYATALEQLGQFQSAAETYRRCIEMVPDHADAWASLISLPDVSSEAEIARAMTFAQSLAPGEKGRIRLCYAIGKQLDRMEDYAQAAHWFKLANDGQSQNTVFNPKVAENSFALLGRIFDAEKIASLSGGNNDGEGLVLIVGLPRTGTSLSEQIIASHPDAFGAGELQTLQQSINRLFPPLQDLPQFEAAIADASAPSRVSALANAYMEEIDRLSPPNAQRVVDKFPHNFIHLGLFAAAFPKASIIHCVRDPRDVATSCYMNAFKMDYDYTTNFDNFFGYEAQHNNLMKHWSEVLPNPPLKVVYEDLVRDTESQIRRIIDFIGLPWNDACLNFSETKRGVRTPSYWQVRQQVYDKSIGRWTHYRSLVEPAYKKAIAEAVS